MGFHDPKKKCFCKTCRLKSDEADSRNLNVLKLENQERKAKGARNITLLNMLHHTCKSAKGVTEIQTS
jgi:hypothetical protein